MAELEPGRLGELTINSPKRALSVFGVHNRDISILELAVFERKAEAVNKLVF